MKLREVHHPHISPVWGGLVLFRPGYCLFDAFKERRGVRLAHRRGDTIAELFSNPLGKIVAFKKVRVEPRVKTRGGPLGEFRGDPLAQCDAVTKNLSGPRGKFSLDAVIKNRLRFTTKRVGRIDH